MKKYKNFSLSEGSTKLELKNDLSGDKITAGSEVGRDNSGHRADNEEVVKVCVARH